MHTRLALVALAGAVTLVGCQSTEPATTPADPSVAAGLDTGPYNTEPGAAAGPAGEDGAAVEARRMADHVAGPWRVDDTLTGRMPLIVTMRTGPVGAGPESLRQVLPSGLDGVAAAHGFLTGFSSYRSAVDDDAVNLTNAVLRFPDPEGAAAAATEMAAALEESYTPVPVEGRPETTARIDRDGTRVFVESFTPRGPFVLYQSAVTGTEPADPDGAAFALIGRTLDAQEPLLDDFEATETAALPELPKDPSADLLARTLTAPGNKVPGLSVGVWRPAGWLHFEDDPLSAAPLFDDTGVEWVSQMLATVYQARDEQAAAHLADGLADAATVQPDVVELDGVDGLAGARCFERTQGAAAPTDPPSVQRMVWHTKCVAHTDRYVFTTFSQTETDAKQQLSAQYRILTAT